MCAMMMRMRCVLFEIHCCTRSLLHTHSSFIAAYSFIPLLIPCLAHSLIYLCIHCFIHPPLYHPLNTGRKSRRTLSQFGTRICPRNRLLHLPTTPKTRHAVALAVRQALPISIESGTVAHSRFGNLSPGYKATKLTGGPHLPTTQVV